MNTNLQVSQGKPDRCAFIRILWVLNLYIVFYDMKTLNQEKYNIAIIELELRTTQTSFHDKYLRTICV